MIITKELIWMKEYMSSVSHLLPRLKQLKRISSKRGNKERFQHFHGLITYFDKKSYRLTFYVSWHNGIKDKIVPYSTIDLLRYLAHELAHLEHWDHSPDHASLESIIMGIFMVKLKQAGYISEEYEEKNGKFY